MKLKVLKCFVDKVNGKTYNVDDVIDVSDARGKEILSHPLELVEVVESEEKSKKKKSDSE